MTDARTAPERHPTVRVVAAAVAVSASVLPALVGAPFTPGTVPAKPATSRFEITQETAATPEDLSLCLTNSSFREIRNPVSSLESKLGALEELCADGAAGLPTFVANELNGSRLNLRWRAALVHVAERVQSHDSDVRSSLAAGLLRSALVFRDAQPSWTDGPLWAAVRTLGGLMKVEQAGVLLEFLGANRLPTRQVALQALQNMLARDADASRLLPENVKARLGQLAETYVNADVLVSGENIALAANACCAAFLANVANVDDLRARVRSLGRPALERQIVLAEERARGRTGFLAWPSSARG